jgi:hypothetical protein
VRRALGDANPGWAALLGAVGIVLGTGWWIYQTSGYYPYYVLMIQRSLWWREFDPGSVSSFAATFGTAVRLARRVTGFNMLSLQRMVELSSMIYGLALCCSQLPPRWPGGERIAIPLHWRVGALGTFALMVASGQSHAVERYTASNVFAVLIWYRLVFGAPNQRVTWRAWTFPGLVRWTWLLSGPVLWGLAFCLLGWEPLA